MFLQDNDPHHLHPDPNSLYYFIIAAVILTGLIFFFGVRLMSFLDNRYERKRTKTADSKSGFQIDSSGEDDE